MRSITKVTATLGLVIGTLLLMSPSPAPKAAPTTKITIFVGFGTGFESSQVEVHDALEKEFNSTIGKEKGIILDFIQSAYAEASQKFTSLMASGKTPDIVGPIGMLGIGKFRDEWLDIAPLLAEDKFDVSGYSRALFNNLAIMRDARMQQLGIPLTYHPTVLFYNRDLFDQAGLEYPPTQWGSPDWTYERLYAMARKLTLDTSDRDADNPLFAGLDNPRQYGYAGNDWGSWRGWICKYFDAKGRPATLGVSDDMKTATMNSPEWKRAFADTRMMITSGIRPMDSSVFDDNTPLGSGKAAMWEYYSWISYDFVNWDDKFNWNIAAVPGLNGKAVSPTNTDTFVMTRSSKNPDKAWEVYKWLYSPATAARLARNYRGIPALKSIQTGWLKDRKEGLRSQEYPGEFEYENPPRPHINWEVMLEAANYADTPNHESWVPNFARVREAQEEAWKSIVSGHVEDSDALAETLNKEVQGYLDTYWASH